MGDDVVIEVHLGLESLHIPPLFWIWRFQIARFIDNATNVDKVTQETKGFEWRIPYKVNWKGNGPYSMKEERDEQVHIAHILTPSHETIPRACEGIMHGGGGHNGKEYDCRHTKMLAVTSHGTWPRVKEGETNDTICWIP